MGIMRNQCRSWTALFLILWPLLSAAASTSHRGTRAAEAGGGNIPGNVLRAIDRLQLMQGTQDGKNKPAVTVLHFWAEWCTPCLQQLPAYNELVRKMNGVVSVRFVSVSTDSPAFVKRFLSRRQLEGDVAVDPGGSLHSLLEIRALPTTVLLGRDGHALATGPSDQVGERQIRAALDGRLVAAVSPARRGNSVSSGTCPSGSLVDLHMNFTNVADGAALRSTIHFDDNGFRGEALTLSMLVQQAYGVRASQIDWDIVEGTERFDVCITSASTAIDWAAMLRSVLEASLGIRGTEVNEERDSYQLVGCAPKLKASSPEDESWIERRIDAIEAHAIDIQGLALTIEAIVGKPVTNLVAWEDRVDIALHWQPDEPESLRSALREYGLDLRNMRGMERRVVVRRVECRKPTAGEATPTDAGGMQQSAGAR